MNDWQHGYDLAYLKTITALFERNEKPYTFGAFGRLDERMVAAALADETLVLGDGYAFIRRRTNQRATVNDYAGPVAELPVGTVVIRRPVADDGGEMNHPTHRALIDHIRREIRGHPVMLEGFAECMGTRMVAAGLDIDWVSAKVRASSEIVGIWGRDIRTIRRRAVERAGIGPLELTVDPGPLAEALPVVSEWADHYSSYNLRSSWTAVALRGYGGDPAFIIKPSEMSKKWKAEHPDEMTWTVEDTPIRDILPEAEPIIDAIPGDKERIRLMRLAPGNGELARHADITDPDAGVADGRVMRIHVPLVTNPDVIFTSWSDTGSRYTAHMERGSVWYLDTRKPHRAVNGGAGARIHLVLDVWANKEIREMLEKGLKSWADGPMLET